MALLPTALLLVPFPGALGPAAAHPAASLPGQPAGQSQAQDDGYAEALAEADLRRRRGRLSDALALTDELLEDDEEDARALTIRARIRLDRCEYTLAEETAQEALDLAGSDGERAAAARVLGEVLVELGRPVEAGLRIEGARVDEPFLRPGERPEDAWLYVRLRDALGDVDGAERFARSGAATDPGPLDWRGLLAKARCQRRIGQLPAASASLVAADAAAKKGAGAEPEVLAELGSLYFESEREIEASGKRSAGNLYREALEIRPGFEDALLGQFELHRFNRRRRSKTPEEILGELFAVLPDSIPGLVASASADLEDGQLVKFRETLARLDGVAPQRRDVRALHAALAWVEHRRDDAAAILEELLKDAPRDSVPERTIGVHLSELYRFAESIDFLRGATQRNSNDYEAWTQLAKSLANTGDEEGAREALGRAEAAARGRRDAFRSNLALVLDRMNARHRVESFGALSFSWQPDAAEVLETYLVPYYAQAREELAERYGHTPGPTRIAVFRELSDFSVRSVGFEGFPALGVCFGPVVTAVSPLSQLRGSFSWARTGFHEFSHVVHLGLSNNRCPRWITEGLATWEEVERNPTWTRNMRRDLIDAYANDDLIPVRELNRAFRGPRILFGYYQGGLLCEMLIEEHGFAPMVDILRAFNLGADLDKAFEMAFDRTPEDVDAAFERFVAKRIEGLALEPRWGRKRTRLLQLRLGQEPPADPEERAAWAEGWTTVAYGAYQERRKVDAERALELIKAAGDPPLRAQVLMGEVAMANGQVGRARRIWERAVEAGAREVRMLTQLGQLQLRTGDDEQGEATLRLAAESFPGFDAGARSPERLLADLFAARGDTDASMKWREEWLRWNAGDYDKRMEVARWHAGEGRHGRAAELFEEANEVDMFRRDLHLEWARSLEALGRFREAEREYRMALAVPAILDPDHVVVRGGNFPGGKVPAGAIGSIPQDQLEPVPLEPEERAELHEARARCLAEIGDDEGAAAARAAAKSARDGA